MKYAVGVDVGGTNIRIAIVDIDGNIKKVLIENTTTVKTNIALLEQIVSLYEKIEAYLYSPIAIGIGVPGPVSSIDGHVYVLPNLSLVDIPFKTYLEEKLKLPVYVGNDANVAALCEAKVGAGKNANVVQYITLSTGIGGGLVINGKMVTGHYGFAQEIGSMVIQKGSYRPSIYKPAGCIEGLCSGNQLKVIAKDNGLIINHAGELFQLVTLNDPTAKKIKAEWIDNLAAFIGSIVSYFEPDIIVLGGGLMKSKDMFLYDLIRKVDDYVFEYLKGKINIVAAIHEQDAGIIGAAMQCF